MFRKTVKLIVLLALGVLSACTVDQKENKTTEEFVLWQDDLGREVKIKKGANRFLPFAPSVTEILYLFCDTSEIVGRTQNCNYPPAVLSKPIINNYPPDLEGILLRKPDLLITKDGMLSIAQAEAIEKMGIPVYFQQYNSVKDIFKGIVTLSEITGHAARGKIIADSLQKGIALDTASAAAQAIPKVLMLISKESYFCFGKNTYASDMVRYAGGINAVDSIFENPYPILTTEYILKTDPEIIIGGPDVSLEKDFFERHQDLKRTSAYKNKNYYTIDDDYLSRPGPRVTEAVLSLRDIIQKSRRPSDESQK